MTADGALSGAGTDGVRERDVVVERDPKLDDAEEEQREQRQDEGEFRHRLAVLRSKLSSLAAVMH